jgi:NAD(P)-dependent dehydrogenase (short-subunit alcohol dehydrogenase family)
MANKTWFITGTSRGFGREWTKAALERGDRVAAAARDKSTLDDLGSEYGDALLALTLDVTDRDAAFGAVARAHEHFGGLDVVVKNAGYGHFGMVDEISEQEARAQIETNLFGALWVTQAALPLLAGGDQPGTGSRGQGVRDQRHARRAGGLLDRLERSVGQALQAESGL